MARKIVWQYRYETVWEEQSFSCIVYSSSLTNEYLLADIFSVYSEAGCFQRLHVASWQRLSSKTEPRCSADRSSWGSLLVKDTCWSASRLERRQTWSAINFTRVVVGCTPSQAGEEKVWSEPPGLENSNVCSQSCFLHNPYGTSTTLPHYSTSVY